MLGNASTSAVLGVKNLNEARKFYEDMLELEVARELPETSGILYRTGNTTFLVYETQYGGTNQATAMGFEVDDPDKTVEELKAKGVTFEQYDMPGVTREGDIHVMGEYRAAWFKDPAGNILVVSNEM